MRVQAEIRADEAEPEPLDVTRSVALARLIEEVRNELSHEQSTAYNRTYHRHNR